MGAGQLNVVIHGLFAIVYHEKCIEVLAPVVGDEHTPRALFLPTTVGAQAIEYPLSHGEAYILGGVESPTSVTRFPKEASPVLERFRVINRANNALFCSIYLPFPLQASTLRIVPGKAQDFFHGQAKKQIASNGMPLVHVLTYEFSDHRCPRLLGTTWTDVGNFINEADETVNLHLFSERLGPPAQPPPRVYAIHSFPRLTALFPGMDLELSKTGWAAPAEADQRSLYERTLPQNQNFAQQATIDNSKKTLCFSLVVDNT